MKFKTYSTNNQSVVVCVATDAEQERGAAKALLFWCGLLAGLCAVLFFRGL